MSDQGSPIPGQPDVVGPEGTPDTAGHSEPPYGDPNDPYEKRYTDLRSWTDRVSQENANQRGQLSELQRQQQLYEALLSSDDADTRREIAEALGYELDEEEDDQATDPQENPLAKYDERLQRIETAQQAREQEQDDAAYAAEVRAIVDERLDQLQGLDKDDQDWVLAYAINALPSTDEGLPDIEQAFQVFTARETARQRAWAQSKRAPRISPNGQPGTEVPNLDDRQQRQDWMTRRLQDQEAQY